MIYFILRCLYRFHQSTLSSFDGVASKRSAGPSSNPAYENKYVVGVGRRRWSSAVHILSAGGLVRVCIYWRAGGIRGPAQGGRLPSPAVMSAAGGALPAAARGVFPAGGVRPTDPPPAARPGKKTLP